MTTSIPTIQLNDGNSIPVVAYGTGTAHDKRYGPGTETVALVKDVINIGYHHIDTAENYDNEDLVGAGIKASNTPREQLFITAKHSGFGPAADSLDKTLAKLGVEYVDLYLLHSFLFATSERDLQQKWAELEALKKSGKAKSIGVSNCLRQHIEIILKTAEIRPAVNQIEYHPYYQRDGLVPWLKEEGIVISCYSSLTPLTAGRPGPVDGVLSRLAGKYGVTESEIGLRWCLDQGLIISSTSTKVDRMKGYLERLFVFHLTQEEIEEIANDGKGKDFTLFGHYFAEKEPLTK